MKGKEVVIRVLLVDDHQLLRQGIHRMLQDDPMIDVVAEAGTGREAIKLARELNPDVVLMDVTMPDLNGVSATRQIKAMNPRMKVFGLSMHTEFAAMNEMFAAGASGYMGKDGAFDNLLGEIKSIALQENYVTAELAAATVHGWPAHENSERHFCGAGLTEREREVLQLVAEGKCSKEMGFILGLSAKTVDTHRRQVMEKLKLHSVAELTHYAIRNGMTPLQ